MKLVSLNCWCGKQFEALASFVREQAKENDIFCFQEMVDAPEDYPDSTARTDLFTQCRKRLPGFECYFHPMIDGMRSDGTLTDRSLPLGQAMCIREDLAHGPVTDRFMYRSFNETVEGDISSIPRNIQYVTLTGLKRPLNLLNFHGLWWNSSKDDNEHRLEQSNRILELLDTLEGEVILVGDFNLKQNTKSLGAIEKRLRNLNPEFGITDTRTSLYRKPIREADYVLVSDGIAAKSLEAPDLPISDHRPMILEFDLA